MMRAHDLARQPSPSSANIVALDKRAQGMPDAAMHPQPRVRKIRSTQAKSPQVHRRSRHSLRDGFTVSFALFPVIGLFVTVIGGNLFRRFDASVEASEPHDFAVRLTTRFVSRIESVHRIPCPTSVTIAIRPS